MNIIFAKTRYDYQSYTDFWDLVRLSGFSTCYFDEIDFHAKDTVYITTPINGEQPPHIRSTPGRGPGERDCKIVWWFLERPDGSGDVHTPVTKSVDEGLAVFDHVWSSDMLVASMDTRLQFVVLGGHKGLCDVDRSHTLYDFTHQSYAWGRREAIYGRLRSIGLQEGPSCWGNARATILSRSKLMLNLQQYHMNILTPLRFALAAAYRLPVVSERLHDKPAPLHSDDFMQADYEHVVDFVASASRKDLSEYGHKIYHRYCEDWTFRRGVEEGVAALR